MSHSRKRFRDMCPMKCVIFPHFSSVRGFGSARSPSLSAEEGEDMQGLQGLQGTLSAESDERAKPSADEYD
jgi:hypothetical protein